MKYLNQTKVMVVAAILIHRIETMVVEVEPVSVTGQLGKLTARSRHIG